MASQHQNIDDSSLDHSQVQQNQANRDAVSLQNSSGSQVVVHNSFLQLFRSSESVKVGWNWGIKLLNDQLPEIRKRLTDTLGRDHILMDVSIKEQPNWVNRAPFVTDRTLQIDGEDCGILDANKMLIETFGRDDIKGKLLILGAPGAGKTTALLSLAEQLVYGAISQPKTVIPVIFELSNWQNDRDIKDWLIEQLYDHHKGDRKLKRYEQWLEQQVLLPLMDGLDELDLDRQTKCTEKLNEFASYYPHLVVCCRINQFETVDIKLRNLRGAVRLQPLSDSQIQNYLDIIKRPELWDAIQTTPSLQAMLEPTTDGDPGLLRVPLFVKLLADVYDPQQPISSKTDLLGKYINRQLLSGKRDFDRRKELKKSKWAYKTVELEPDPEKTTGNLRWLARNLQVNNKIDFLVEHLQPSLIDSKLQNDYSQLFWFVLTISGFPIFILIYQEMCNQIHGGIITREKIVLESCLIFPIIIWLFREIVRRFRGSEKASWLINESRKTGKIEAVEDFYFQSLFTENVLIKARAVFLLKVSVGIIILWSIAWTGDSLIGIRTFPSIMVATFLNLIVCVINLTKQELKLNNRAKPNQGIHNSFRTYFVLTFIIWGSWCIFKSQLPATFLPFALLLSFFVGGGKACLQHLCLRIILWRSGSLPLDLPQFLNYCVERRLLLRVGGSYRFLHRELLDHFAKSDD